MASEAIQRVRRSNPANYTCADGAAIAKGTLMVISGDRVAAASSADGEFFVGILARDKIANDGRTTCAIFFDGVFDITTVASPATIAIGEAVKIAGANLIDLADDSTVGNKSEIVGMSQEAVTATVQETIRVDIGRN